ncbi:hypothetical protein FisN_4Hh089 [Fistulifera solaris]|uniref:Uncharacterized protein n=1 Tax=Fistulifera solaris TaxID=1519565 RepID=A0A1Z5KE20_FISSO|nr:hypothetical protein FisN_4Hh089 [Fistulifera solaris]|eukprot:GAX24570.1 hypothetical protein FisN_4Hh089 [Fistulifera solaris]
MKTICSLLYLLATLFVCQTNAFVSRASVISRPSTPVSSVALQERRWNFNDGQSPWGMKKNAEIWNGRFAQMAFVIVFLQELVQGKGVFEGLAQGDPVNYAVLGMFGVSLVGLTAWLAIQGDDDFVAREM